MKDRYSTWCCLVIGLGYFSETFSKSLHPDKDTKTLNPFSTVPNDLTGYTFEQISDNQENGQMKDEKIEKNLITNATLLRNIKKDNKFQSKLSSIGNYVFGNLLLVLCILALLGNGCALTIFRFRQRRLIPMEVYFISLAISDILLSVSSYPMAIIASFMQGWNFGELGCTIYAFCCYFFSLSSIYTITAMAFTRYLITCKPVHGNLITSWKCCKMVASGYLLAFLLAAMPLLGFGNYEVEPFGLSCTLDWIAKDSAAHFYIILVTIFCVFLPLFILVFCYSQIILLVKQSSVQMKSTGVHKQSKKGSSGQLTLTTGLISAGFAIAWCPYTIACLWTSFQGNVILPIWATPGPCLFAKSSIVYNPIIYIFLTERYQKDFYDLVKYISCKSGVKEMDRSHITKIVSATDEDCSNSQHADPSTYAEEMEEQTFELSYSFVPGMKQTYV